MEEADFDQMENDHLDRLFDTNEFCPECEKTVPVDEFDSFNGICNKCREAWGDNF